MCLSLTGDTIGRFVIGGRLGKGGMGEAYRAEDTRLSAASPSSGSRPTYTRILSIAAASRKRPNTPPDSTMPMSLLFMT
jgi:hypothetical protein